MRLLEACVRIDVKLLFCICIFLWCMGRMMHQWYLISVCNFIYGFVELILFSRSSMSGCMSEILDIFRKLGIPNCYTLVGILN